MKTRIALLITALMSPTLTFAMFCPTNFNQINIGDSMAQVEAQCGKPSSETSSKDVDDSMTPQEWTYYVTIPQDQFTSAGSIKLTLAFVDGKVVNISSGGNSVGSTTVCGGNLAQPSTTVQMGSTIKDVTAACGKPTMINKGTAQPGQPEPTVTDKAEWTYDGPPKVVLKFENGKLTERS